VCLGCIGGHTVLVTVDIDVFLRCSAIKYVRCFGIMVFLLYAWRVSVLSMGTLLWLAWAWVVCGGCTVGCAGLVGA